MSAATVKFNMERGRGNLGALETQLTLTPATKPIKWSLVLLYLTFVAVGSIGGPMLQRLYYMHGGKRIWLSSWLESVGFPLFLAPLCYFYSKQLNTTTTSVFFMETNLLISSTGIGIILGFDNYMYSFGLSYLPVSTSSLLLSTTLAFTALFAFLLVKQKLTFYSMNSVVLTTLGALVLALHTSSDRPPGVTHEKYLLGFFITLASSVLLGLVGPLVELAYSKSKKPIGYVIVMQFQFMMGLSSTVVCTIGMLVSKDFQIISTEARDYGLGEVKYYVVLVASAIMWQLLSLGVIGIINCTSSLFAGIVTAVLFPLTQLAAIIAFHEKFSGEKGMSLALSLWGFTSYFIGEYKKTSTNQPFVDITQDREKNLEFDS